MGDYELYEQYAKKVRIFKGMSPDDVGAMLRQGQVLQYEKGKTIFHEGMLGNNLFIVLNGEVGIYAKNALLAKCEVGETFGEMAILNQRPRSATAAALKPTALFTIDDRHLYEVFDKHIAVRLLLNIINTISERLETANAENVLLRHQVKEARESASS